MPSATSLCKYINLLDEVILSGDAAKADELQDEVLAVFDSELEGLRNRLTNYQPGVFATFGGKTVSSGSVDFIKDARILRARLQAELEKNRYGKYAERVSDGRTDFKKKVWRRI